MLQQISVNKMFEDEYFYLSALNDFITSSKDKFYDFFSKAGDVPSAEEHFQIDKYDDLTRTHKPTIYISTEELYLVHALLIQYLEDVVCFCLCSRSLSYEYFLCRHPKRTTPSVASSMTLVPHRKARPRPPPVVLRFRSLSPTSLPTLTV